MKAGDKVEVYDISDGESVFIDVFTAIEAGEFISEAIATGEFTKKDFLVQTSRI